MEADTVAIGRRQCRSLSSGDLSTDSARFVGPSRRRCAQQADLWCVVGRAFAGIVTGQVSRRTVGYADVDANSPAAQGFRAREVGIIRATAGPLRGVPPEVD